MKILASYKKGIYGVVAAIFAFLFVSKCSAINVLNLEKSAAYSIWSILFCVLTYVGYLYLKDYKKKISVFLFSYLFLGAFLTGFVVRNSNGGGVFEYYLFDILLGTLGGTLGVTYVVSVLLDKLQVVSEEPEKKWSTKKYFWTIFGILLISWIPVFLAYYPGIFAYDVHTQVTQMNTGEYTTHHPLLHTLLLQLFYRMGENFGSYNLGVVAYVVFQTILVAMSISYAILYLYEKGVNKTVRRILVAFFALCPVNSILAISVTKDILFSAAMLFFIIQLLRFIEEEKRRESIPCTIVLFATGVVTFLMRNNARYVLLVWTILWTIYILRSKWEKTGKIVAVLLMVGILMIGKVADTGMIKALDAEEGSINEALSLPIAQISRCYFFKSAEIDMTLQNEFEVLNLTPGDYGLPVIDIAKGKIQIEGQEELFFNVWKKLLKTYPTIYMDSLLYLHQGDWSLDDISTAHVYGASMELRTGYLLTGTAGGYGVEHKSLFPALENLYEEWFSGNGYQDILVFFNLFTPALYFWLLLVCLLHAFLTGNKKVLLVGSLLVLYYGTVLLGPCTLIRYSYPLVLSAPILAALELTRPLQKTELAKNK